MKKALIIAAAAMTLSACNMNQNNTVKQSDLLHHRFELVSVDGQTVNSQQGKRPTIEFGENMHVSGNMCNRFAGQGLLESNVLTVKALASTRMMCADQNLNQWDQLIGQVLQDGATLSLQQDKLTLKGEKNQLVYELKDLVN